MHDRAHAMERTIESRFWRERCAGCHFARILHSEDDNERCPDGARGSWPIGCEGHPTGWHPTLAFLRSWLILTPEEVRDQDWTGRF